MQHGTLSGLEWLPGTLGDPCCPLERQAFGMLSLGGRFHFFMGTKAGRLGRKRPGNGASLQELNLKIMLQKGAGSEGQGEN